MPSFDDLDAIEKEYSIGGDKWFRPRQLDPGVYAVKLLSPFEVKAEYWDEAAKRSYIRLGKDKNPAETNVKEENFRIAYLIWILDRSDNRIKMAELGHRIMKDIGGLKKTPGYEFEVVPSYDILIKKEKTGNDKKDVKYTVLPGRDGASLTSEQEREFKEKESPEVIVQKMKDKRLKELSKTPTLNI